MQNYLIKAMNKKRDVRAFVIKAQDVVAQACETHDTWSASSVALGRVLLGTVLLGANLKGKDEISVVMKGNGSGGSIVAQSDARGHVKAYIQNPHVAMKKISTGEVFVTQATGNKGTFTVVKDMGLKTPYTGQIPFVTGEVAEEFTYYLTDSEQTPSSVGLNVCLDEEDRVKIAGGFMVQLMPDASKESIDFVENQIQKMPAISEILADNAPAEKLLEAIFGKEGYDVLETIKVSFQCDCSKEKFGNGLYSLGSKEIQAMIVEQQGCEAVCHFCKKKYWFSEEELRKMIGE